MDLQWLQKLQVLLKINATCATKERWTIETDEAIETFLATAEVKDPAWYRELQQFDLQVVIIEGIKAVFFFF